MHWVSSFRIIAKHLGQSSCSKLFFFCFYPPSFFPLFSPSPFFIKSRRKIIVFYKQYLLVERKFRDAFWINKVPSWSSSLMFPFFVLCRGIFPHRDHQFNKTTLTNMPFKSLYVQRTCLFGVRNVTGRNDLLDNEIFTTC